MECIYLPTLSYDFEHYNIPPDEAHHLKALRILSNERIQITNGYGLSAIANVNRTTKTDYTIDIIEYLPNFGEINASIGLAIGILDNKERFEFAIEKSVELGVREIFPLLSDYSQRKHINIERCTAKAIAAMKQCKRSYLPIFNQPMKLDILLQTIQDRSLILCDENGEQPAVHNTGTSGTEATKAVLFVGPEGGFNKREMALFPNRVIKWNLGNRRLRAETAAIVALGYLQNIIQK